MGVSSPDLLRHGRLAPSWVFPLVKSAEGAIADLIAIANQAAYSLATRREAIAVIGRIDRKQVDKVLEENYVRNNDADRALRRAAVDALEWRMKNSSFPDSARGALERSLPIPGDVVAQIRAALRK